MTGSKPCPNACSCGRHKERTGLHGRPCGLKCKCGRHSIDVRKKASIAAKGRVVTESTRRLLRKRSRETMKDPAIRKRISALLKGRKRPAAICKKISAGRQKHLDEHADDCTCLVGANPSALSKRMIDILLIEFPKVIPEKRFGRFRVDAYLPPPYHLAFEADGKYWHRIHEAANPRCYTIRDEELHDKYGLTVIRLTEDEILAF